MQKETFKKIFVFLITIAFLGVCYAPAINADMSKADEEAAYDLLIITPKEFVKELRPLVCHKNSVGVKTRLVTLDKVYEETFWQGRDNAEKVKYFIKSALDEWGIKYVMLVGNFIKMPVRYVQNEDLWLGYLEPHFISDLYFADIYDSEGNFSSWDTDGDGVFGEWLDDGVSTEAEDRDIDLRPDVYVGRLACRNNFEVKIMVHKIIMYETTTYNQTWFKRFVVASGDTYPEGQYPFNTSGYEGEENTAEAIENMSGFEIERLWVSLGTLNGPKDVINAINKGCGFMFFEGHANPMVWGTHPYNSKSFIYGLRLQDMWRLWNMNKMPIVVAGACHNGEFDVTPLNLLRNLKQSYRYGTYSLECWAWKLTSKPFGGSIATISNTGLGMTKEDKQSREGAGDFMDKQFFYVYGNNYSDILGEVWGESINRYLDYFPVNWSTPAANDSAYDAKTVQEWTLFGDPSLKIGGYKQYYALSTSSSELHN